MGSMGPASFLGQASLPFPLPWPTSPGQVSVPIRTTEMLRTCSEEAASCYLASFQNLEKNPHAFSAPCRAPPLPSWNTDSARPGQGRG